MTNASVQYVAMNIQMSHLMGCMNAGIGSSGHGEAQRFRVIIDGHTQYLMQSGFDGALNRAPIRLPSPTEETAAVISKIDAKSCHSHTL